jgi:predicted nucleotidyltransferase
MGRLCVVSPSDKKYICQQLSAIERAENIKILHAIESGSRAWGFPSQDSDFDIRFIYVRPQKNYLSIDIPKDDINTPIVDDAVLNAPFDLAGWDLRKTLKLLLRSNAIVYEWLLSPVLYVSECSFIEQLKSFYIESANLKAITYHYYSIANGLWQGGANANKKLTVKKYLYVIRPVLCLLYIKHQQLPPPMDIASLITGLTLTPSIIETLQQLIDTKLQLTESQAIPTFPILDKLIDQCLSHRVEKVKVEFFDEELKQKADEIFRSYLL